MSQIRWAKIELKKGKRGWHAFLVDANGEIWKLFWRPTQQWAYNAAYSYYKYYVWH